MPRPTWTTCITCVAEMQGYAMVLLSHEPCVTFLDSFFMGGFFSFQLSWPMVVYEQHLHMCLS